MKRAPMRRVLPAAMFMIIFILVACSDSDRSKTSGSTAVGSATTSSTTVHAAPTSTGPGTTTAITRLDEAGQGGIDPLVGASTATVSTPATNPPVALLTAVRAARHEGYDRVVFEFRNVLPGYKVGYTARPVRADPSGEQVAVAGGPVVGVRFELALDVDLNEASAPATYTGPNRFTPGTPEVVELVRTGAFEGVLNWVVGLNDKVDFKVSTLQSPPRVVIDFRNH